MDSIRVRNLSHAYFDRRQDRAVLAVDDASFDVPAGQFVCIVGPSGCGKTTILRVLAGLEPLVEGEMALDDPRPGMVFQEMSLFPWLTVEQNVTYPLRIRGVPRREREERLQHLLRLTGLADFRRAYPHQLSGGMKQRTSVARALMDDRRILLMDEPFGALDEQTRITLQQELLRVWETTAKTVLFITHSVEEAIVLADRILVMSPRPGRILRDIAVPFARPRNVIDLRRDAAFGELAYEIWSLLRHPAPLAA